MRVQRKRKSVGFEKIFSAMEKNLWRLQGFFRNDIRREFRRATDYALRPLSLRLFSLLIISILGCALQPGNPLNDPSKFAEVYTALQIAAAQDSMNVQRADVILRQHGYSRRQFEEAVAHYNAHAEEWAKVLQHVVARLDSVVQAEAKSDSVASRNSTPEDKP